MSDLVFWSWIFLVAYIAMMLGIGVFASRRVQGGDDYAIARGSYGPIMLALAFAATTASGATFLGLPAISYSLGTAALWWPFLYPIGAYIGVYCCLRVVSRDGNSFGSRSIPEYLGDRYNSEFIRLSYSIFSLILLFYLAGQLVAGLVMFEQMLGLSKATALSLTTIVLLIYVSLGGAHADIISDGIQGALMVLIALLVVVLFLMGVETDSGTVSVVQALQNQDPELVTVFSDGHPMFSSPLTIFLMVLAHIPLGMLPHIGNKLWALKSPEDRSRFFIYAFIFAMILPCMALGGLLARVYFGEDLTQGGSTPNQAIPALFVELMPAWLAALLSIAILSAVMSTADGLVVSTSQVFANDIYRRSLAPKWRSGLTESDLDKEILNVSRISTVVVLLGAALLGWSLLGQNVALIVWIGIGGMTSALAGPLVLGSQWLRVNRQGAIAGMISGAGVFISLHTGLVVWGFGLAADSWLSVQSANSFTCSGLGVISSVVATVLITLITEESDSNKSRA